MTSGNAMRNGLMRDMIEPASALIAHDERGNSRHAGRGVLHRPRRVAVSGLSHFGRKLAALMEGPGWRARYLETRGWEPRAGLRALRRAATADIVYHVGGQVARFSRPHALRALLRRPTVMHWAGSDVLYARAAVRAGRATPALLGGVTHWAGAPWLAAELREIGVSAAWVPHSWVDAPATLPPLPDVSEPFTVLAYLPEGRADFYGGEAVLRLARELPQVRVLVVAAAALPWASPANVQCLGWVPEMETIYARCHALLRLPHHDGLSFMVQEALAYGRFAIWSYPFEGALQSRSAEAAIATVRGLAVHHAAGELPLNERGATYVRERFCAARIRADLLAGFEKVLAG